VLNTLFPATSKVSETFLEAIFSNHCQAFRCILITSVASQKFVSEMLISAERTGKNQMKLGEQSVEEDPTLS
jgi:hypothetical protein